MFVLQCSVSVKCISCTFPEKPFVVNFLFESGMFTPCALINKKVAIVSTRNKMGTDQWLKHICLFLFLIPMAGWSMLLVLTPNPISSRHLQNHPCWGPPMFYGKPPVFCCCKSPIREIAAHVSLLSTYPALHVESIISLSCSHIELLSKVISSPTSYLPLYWKFPLLPSSPTYTCIWDTGWAGGIIWGDCITWCNCICSSSCCCASVIWGCILLLHNLHSGLYFVSLYHFVGCVWLW